MNQHLNWIAEFRRYAQVRRDFLAIIACTDSCRDPLSELSERIVCALLEGTLAECRVQKGHDLTLANGRRVQVKYLANPQGRWRNEHTVQCIANVDDYAIVVFEGLELRAVLVFELKQLASVCGLLGKQHPRQDQHLQFTQRNYHQILKESERFGDVGVRVFSM